MHVYPVAMKLSVHELMALVKKHIHIRQQAPSIELSLCHVILSVPILLQPRRVFQLSGVDYYNFDFAFVHMTWTFMLNSHSPRVKRPLKQGQIMLAN